MSIRTQQRGSKAVWKSVARQIPKIEDLDFEKIRFYDKQGGSDFATYLQQKIKKISRSATVESAGEDIRKHILEIALRSYAEKGEAGLTPAELGQRTGIQALKISQMFKGKSGIKEELIKYYGSKMPRAAELPKASDIKDPIGFVRGLLQGAFHFKDTDPWDFKIQSWMLAAGEPVAKDTASRVCSPLIRLIAELIQRVSPRVDKSTALARATLMLAQPDYYGHLRWSYCDGLDLEISKSKFLEKYREAAIEIVVERGFAP